MKVVLNGEYNMMLSPMVQLCLHRGIPREEIQKYLDNAGTGINSPLAFNEELLKAGASRLISNISNNKRICVIVDSDVDGLTSSAILINYLYSSFPSYTLENVDWRLHTGKQHGLNDHIDDLLNCNYGLVICPDSASNDLKEISKLHDIGTEVLILDHHITDDFSPYAITINSQYDYPNKDLSGAGVVYQFCRYLDTLMDTKYADNFLDLVAIGLQGDMMDIRSLETKELIFKGLREENIRNPLIFGLANKNAFALGKSEYVPSNRNDLLLTPIGASFFIVPLLNAICRSGTMEEKELIFDSMLTMRAFEEIPSNKRGHKLGEMERRVDQALRTCTNVKNRQTRSEEAGKELLENMIQDSNMMDDKVFVFLLEPGQIDRNIAGLVANRLMAKYQRPVCVLTHGDNEYAGSMRGYTKTGIDNFKAIAESSSACKWSRGHENAAGICLDAGQTDKFVEDMNEALKDVSTEIVHYVDYQFYATSVDPNIILELSKANDYIGTGFERPFVYIKEIELDSLSVLKNNTVKLSLPNMEIMMFNINDIELEKLSNFKGTMNAVCKCAQNEWMGNIKPQLLIVDYELIPFNAVKGWEF